MERLAAASLALMATSCDADPACGEGTQEVEDECVAIEGGTSESGGGGFVDCDTLYENAFEWCDGEAERSYTDYYCEGAESLPSCADDPDGTSREWAECWMACATDATSCSDLEECKNMVQGAASSGCATECPY